MADLLVIADDLTGALDTGAQFARHGLRTMVAWSSDPRETSAGGGGRLAAAADVLVLDTESRGLRPAQARARVLHAATGFLPQAVRIYKKVDSTLRGNVGGEIDALLRAGLAKRAILAPAFPAQGRTTRYGQQWVNGTPLEQTPFARRSADCSSISALLRQQTRATIGCVGLEIVRQGADALASFLQAAPESLLVIDAVEEADLAVIARAATQAGLDYLLAGSAGLAGHLPGAWKLTRPIRPFPLVRGPLLIVAGTRHPCLRRQLARLEAQTHARIVGRVLGEELDPDAGPLAHKSDTIVQSLAGGRTTVLTTMGERYLRGRGKSVATILAQVAEEVLQQTRPAALLLTGGGVAMAVCRALGTDAIAVEGQFEPGIPYGRLMGGLGDGLTVITKAGGFGSDGALVRVVNALSSNAQKRN